MDIYHAILKRKSVRKFSMEFLDAETIKDIEEFIKTIKPYKEDIKTKTYILNDEKQIKGLFKIRAPHYIAITSEKKEDYLENVGYILEQLVIYLTQKGIGTCWLGKSVPTVEIEDKESLDFVIMIAFGIADQPIYRESITEFKRKSISEISNLTESSEIIEAIHLSPSAMNRQLWYFDFISENKIIVYRKKDVKLIERMSQIDIGIALSHLYMAAEYKGKNVKYIKESDSYKEGYIYTITCVLN